MTQGSIADNLETVRQQIIETAEANGRSPAEIGLIAVSKAATVAQIKEAYDAGQRCFGENRAQALVEKKAQLPEDIEWHFIGHLQGNKVRPVIEACKLIHAIDSPKLMERIDTVAREVGKVQHVLVQANISGELTKFGGTRRQAASLAEMTTDLRNVSCKGFMTMAPYGASEEELEQIFTSLWSIRDYMRERHALIFPELSMGMTNDFRTALACGATYLRIGSAIFSPADD